MDRGAKTVVVVDDDRDIAELVETVLIDEGFKVACLYMDSESELKEAIERVAPDCVLLDGSGRRDYGVSWTIAAWLALFERLREAGADELTTSASGRVWERGSLHSVLVAESRARNSAIAVPSGPSDHCSTN